MESKLVLVTGGAGFIGSHTCVELLSAGYGVVVLDNLSNSRPTALKRVEKITGKTIPLVVADVTDRHALDALFEKYNFCAVLHFAGLKAVGESCEIPLRYYSTNVEGSVALAEVMAKHLVFKLIFSSSATVYGDPKSVPINESFPTAATNPYGRSKLMVEEIYRDLCRVKSSPWKITMLRYFNPIGAHESGLIGEDPRGIPNNLLPYVAQVAIGKIDELKVFGNDYPTVDGTGVRDYIHVVDVAKGHVRALQNLMTAQPGCNAYNLGTGKGYSVLETVRAFEAATGRTVKYRFVARRSGDIAQCFADPALAWQKLGWKAEYDINRMVTDSWRWQSNNPDGFQS